MSELNKALHIDPAPKEFGSIIRLQSAINQIHDQAFYTVLKLLAQCFRCPSTYLLFQSSASPQILAALIGGPKDQATMDYFL
jgi:hypothetical protein